MSETPSIEPNGIGERPNLSHLSIRQIHDELPLLTFERSKPSVTINAATLASVCPSNIADRVFFNAEAFAKLVHFAGLKDVRFVIGEETPDIIPPNTGGSIDTTGGLAISRSIADRRSVIRAKADPHESPLEPTWLSSTFPRTGDWTGGEIILDPLRIAQHQAELAQNNLNDTQAFADAINEEAVLGLAQLAFFHLVGIEDRTIAEIANGVLDTMNPYVIGLFETIDVSLLLKEAITPNFDNLRALVIASVITAILMVVPRATNMFKHYVLLNNEIHMRWGEFGIHGIEPTRAAMVQLQAKLQEAHMTTPYFTGE